MELHLAGHTVVVVGGAKGIGLAIAEAFAYEQANVFLWDVDPMVQAAASALATSSGQAVEGWTVDATQFGQVLDKARAIQELDAACLHVVYAAGCGSGKYGFPFWNLAPDDWQRVLRVNLGGAVNVAHAFAPQFVEQRGGTLLFLASVAAQMGSQTDPPYSAAKAGLINFAQCAAKDFAPYDVRVNVISPGMVQTAINRSVWQAWYDQQPAEQRQSYEEWAGEKAARVAPLGRWQTGQDIAAAAVFLASARANNITGQTLNVDGGQVMHS